MPDSPKARILIADDEPLYLRTTSALLRKAGYECVAAPDGEAALKALESDRFDLVLSDLNMPGNHNLELLQEQRSRWPDTPLIVITGAPSLPTAIESLRLGIADYLLKPVRFQDLRTSVEKTLARSKLRAVEPDATAARTSPAGQFPEIIGHSPAMQEVLGILGKIANSDANVLITGESGTGKEVVARAIHAHGPRVGKPFQVVDCTAIPESLFESVLFGHVKGSFTGAVRDQEGLLSQADQGTVFFDEIGELPLPLQSKLLRLIQEQTFTPVGKSTPVQLDVRFLSATNRDLELEVNAGRFRRDLFYRLAVLHVELPPLRERDDDVLLLAKHFLQQLQPQELRVRDFSPAAAGLLRSYAWPGNIRELRNAVERGIALASGHEITPADLPKSLTTTSERVSVPAASEPASDPRGQSLQDAELEYLKSILTINKGNVSRAAEQAGMTRQGLHKRLKKAGLNPGDFRS
ncbi:MAG TPA: sigma-54 dependent transcriptional regulator [Caulifigura sp.]|nr:sigma-54 dependent transcriptional regulator [Caulifigura sp.]